MAYLQEAPGRHDAFWEGHIPSSGDPSLGETHPQPGGAIAWPMESGGQVEHTTCQGAQV